MVGKERTGLNKTVLYLIYFCIYSAALLLIGMDLTENQTRQLIGQPSRFHLQPRLTSAGPLLKDFQN